MTDIAQLFTSADRLDSAIRTFENSKSATNIRKLEEIAIEIGKSHSRSWFGYHARVYYLDFLQPPAGQYFSQEYGLVPRLAGGKRKPSYRWAEYTEDEVLDAVYEQVEFNNLDTELSEAEKFKDLCKGQIDDTRSILELAPQDDFIKSLQDKLNEFKFLSRTNILNNYSPSGRIITHDTRALNEGTQAPPHFSVLADIKLVQLTYSKGRELAQIIRRAASHIERLEKKISQSQRIGTNVFIGHGRSSDWRELKDYISDRLHLPYEEFNRVSTAGVATVIRLSQMLDSSSIAFLVMTGEDETAQGDVRARENVVHEAGLFQGRLGFKKAIVLLEEGCSEFSNIKGLGHIPYPKGNIRACFDDVREVLEREGLIPTLKDARSQ
ncbi:MAG: TIR domain-containing protein [Pseudomonadota bacterium]